MCVSIASCVYLRCAAAAIFQEDALPEGMEQYLELNAELAQIWPVITQVIDAPIDAEQWDGVKDKREHLII